MPAKNLYHDAVVAALVADGWTITDDPFQLVIGQRRLYVDLASHRSALTANRGDEQIAVEVQSFLSNSDIDDFHRAIGQYVIYRAVLQLLDPGRDLYLAVPEEVYTGIMSEEIGELVRDNLDVMIIVFDPIDRRIIQWTR